MRLEQARALQQRAFQHAPLRRRDDERHEVDAPGLRRAGRIGEQVVGDAGFAHPRVELLHAQRRVAGSSAASACRNGCQCGLDGARAVDELVETPARRPIARGQVAARSAWAWPLSISDVALVCHRPAAHRIRPYLLDLHRFPALGTGRHRHRPTAPCIRRTTVARMPRYGRCGSHQSITPGHHGARHAHMAQVEGQREIGCTPLPLHRRRRACGRCGSKRARRRASASSALTGRVWSCGRPDGRRGSGSRRSNARSRCRRCRTSAARAARSSDGSPAAAGQARKRTPATASPAVPVAAERQRIAVAGHHVAVAALPRDHDLQRARAKSRRCASAPPAALCSPSTSQGSSAWRSSSDTPRPLDRPSSGKRNSKWGRNHPTSSGHARIAQVGDDALEVGPQEVRQHEAVVQRRAPAHQRPAVGLLPEPGDERADQQLLGEAHARVRRHLEGAELDQAEPAHRPLRRVQLVDADLGPVRIAGDVDQQVAEQPVDQPGRRSASPGSGICRSAISSS